MTQPVSTEVVRKTITVAATPERAFDVFTAQFGRWWPKEHSIGEADTADFVVEPRVGGRWYEIGVDGTECDSGTVTSYDPPERITLAWHVDANWQYDPDPAHASEVEVRFVADGPTHTRVELEHRGIERHGGGADAIHGAVDSPKGWSYCLEQFAAFIAT